MREESDRIRSSVMVTVRLLWVDPPMAMQGWEVEVDRSLLETGRIEPQPDSFPGPAGSYLLLPEEQWRTLAVQQGESPAPTFVHESYSARLEKWVQSVPDAVDEIAIIARVRDAVTELAETRVAADPAAFSVGPTVTSTEPTPQGIAIVGRCLILQPSTL